MRPTSTKTESNQMDGKPSNSLRKTLELRYGIQIPKISELLIWSIGFTFVVALTIREFVPLITEYMDNNIATQVQVILFDNEFRPPHTVISLPQAKIRNQYGDGLMMLALYLHENDGSHDLGPCRICHQVKNASWDVWNDNMQRFDRTSLTALYNDLSLAFVKRVFMELRPDSPVIFENTSDPVAGIIMSAVINYFEWVSHTDYYLGNKSEPDYKYAITPPSNFVENFQDYDKKLDLALEHVLKGLCKRISYEEWIYPDEFRSPVKGNNTCTDLLLHSDGAVYFDGIAIWLQLPSLKTPTFKDHSFVLKEPAKYVDNQSLIADVGTGRYLTMFLYSGRAVLYESAIDPVYSRYIYQTPMESRKGGQMIVARYKVQMRAKETRLTQSCPNETTVPTCFVQCTKLWIVEKCNCVQFIFKKALPLSRIEGKPYCTPDSYAACNITELPAEVSAKCLAQCKRNCGYTIYSWQIAYEDFDSWEPNTTQITLSIVPLFDSYTEFSWTVKDTPEQFFSQLAGVCNFYLGFSGLSLFAIIIWIMNWWKRYKQLKKDRVATSELQAESSGWMAGGGFSHHQKKPEWMAKYEKSDEWMREVESKLRLRVRDDIEAIVAKKLASRSGN